MERGHTRDLADASLTFATNYHANTPGPLGFVWDLDWAPVEPDDVVGWHHLFELALFEARALVFAARRWAALAALGAAHLVTAQPPGGTVMALDFPAPFYFDRPWCAAV